MYFVQHIETISHQPTFGKVGFWMNLLPIESDSSLQSPDFKAFVSPNALRRMSTILRLGIACSKACMNQVGREFDAISAGTSLGCLTDTEKFLVTINTVSGDILSPTAFIQSTHNTISGQISLELKNHSYNMTHTQNALSFEVALKDGMLCVDEGKKTVLVGAADEAIPFMERFRGNLIQTTFPLTTLGTFLVLSNQPNAGVNIELVESTVYFTGDFNAILSDFVSNNSIDLVVETGDEFNGFGKNHCNVLPFCGYNQSASAFAFHLASDRLKFDETCKTALIVNSLDPNKLGLTLLRRYDS